MDQGQPRNIIISHAYSKDNKGDAALLSVLIRETQRKFKPAKLTVLSLDTTKPGETFEGVPVEHAFMYFANFGAASKPAKLAYGIYIMSATTVWAYARRYLHISLPLPKSLRKIAKLYAEADLVIAVGGGYLRGQRDLTSIYNLMLLTHPLFVASALGTPTALYAQSFGPFYHTFEERLIRYTFNRKVSAIITREQISKDLLEKIGVTKPIVKSVDAGFLFTAPKSADLRKMLKAKPKQLIVGITVRAWMQPEKQAKYEQAIASLADHLVKKYGAKVVFIPQVTAKFHHDDDREVGQRVRKLIKHKKDVEVLMENYDHHQIKALYSDLDFIVGTRFHSIIFSLTAFVPALAIEYEHKTSGIMKDLGLDDWWVKIEDVSAELLIQKADELIVHGEDYRKKLRKVLPGYIKQASDSIDIVAETYADAASR
ncbi:MAG TPA: polysaccharide pyruvyl transferase family protein [Candidatus Saccharimonadales bacterium]